MISGIYSASFISNGNLAGTGIVVIDGASLHGGDGSYIYKGKYRLTEKSISATVDAQNFTGQPTSVLGPISSFRLTLSGVAAPHGFILSGSVEGMPDRIIKIDLIKRSDLVQN